MSIQESLSLQFFSRHPSQAADYLANLPDSDIVEIFQKNAKNDLEHILAAMDPYVAGKILSCLDVGVVKELLSDLKEQESIRILRTIDRAVRKSM